MMKIPFAVILGSVPFLAMSQGPTADEIRRNLPAGSLVLQAKPSDIDGYELTVTYVNRTNHVVYMPPLEAGTTMVHAYAKHGKSYRQVPLRPSKMQIHRASEMITDFKALSPGAKDSFTIFLNKHDIEGQKTLSKFDLTWSLNLILPDKTQKPFRLDSNSTLVK